MNSRPKTYNLGSIIALAILCILIIIFWNTIVVFPLKIFVVLLHELSHGLAAIATGGSIVKIELNANQGGLCQTRGGIPFVVMSAGYLGSMIWGGIILIAAARTRLDKTVSIAIGATVLLITALFIRNSYGLLFGIAFGVAMIAIGVIGSMEINDFIVKVIGLTSILYAVIDIKDDLISRQSAMSDASRLAAAYFGTPLMWGVIWIILALLMAYLFLKIASRE